MPVIDPLTPARYCEASLVLARAFHEDPMWVYLAPDPVKRPGQLAWFFTCWARVLGPRGGLFVTQDGKGAAMWIPAGKGIAFGVWEQLRTGLWAAPFRLGAPWLWRARPILNDMFKATRHDIQEPHWILDVLGVDPPCHGKGFGRALVEQGLALADAQHQPAYVITHTPRNVPFYQQFGFELVGQNDVVPGKISRFSLRRTVR